MRSYLLFPFTFIAYSAGAALANLLVPENRRLNPLPGLLETVVVVVALVGAGIFRLRLWDRTLAPAWVASVIMVAFALRAWLVRLPITGLGGSGDFTPLPVHSVPLPPSHAARMWVRWRCFAQAMADFQGRVLLTFFYFGLVTPLAFWVTYFKDPLQLRTGRTSWIEREPPQPDLEKARRQF